MESKLGRCGWFPNVIVLLGNLPKHKLQDIKQVIFIQIQQINFPDS